VEVLLSQRGAETMPKRAQVSCVRGYEGFGGEKRLTALDEHV